MPNHHLSQTVRIGQITADGQFEILESTDGPVAPQAWNQFEPSSKGIRLRLDRRIKRRKIQTLVTNNQNIA